MRHHSAIIGPLSALVLAFASAIFADTPSASARKESDSTPKAALRIVTENYPPYNFVKDGEIVGFCTDMVREIMRRTRYEFPIEMTDWNNAYHLALNEKQYVVYSINQTEFRKPLFQWVGPLITNRWAFFCRADRDIRLKTLDDARNYKIGTYYNDVCEDFLNEHAFDNVLCSHDDSENVKKLVSGEIDLWLMADLRTADRFAAQAGVDHSKIKPICYVQETSLHIGFNSKAPGEIVRRFQETFDEIRKDGTYEASLKQYFSGSSAYPTDLPQLSLPPSKPANVVPKEERPAVSDGDANTLVPVTFKVRRHLFERLRQTAEEEDREIDEVCRRAVEQYIREVTKSNRKREREKPPVKKTE